MIKLVIFDLDGTLVNAYPAVSRSVNYTLGALGFAPRSDAEIKRSVGSGDRRLMAHFVGEKLADRAHCHLPASSYQSLESQRDGEIIARRLGRFEIFKRQRIQAGHCQQPSDQIHAHHFKSVRRIAIF